jgi:hypothetical protein
MKKVVAWSIEWIDQMYCSFLHSLMPLSSFAPGHPCSDPEQLKYVLMLLAKEGAVVLLWSWTPEQRIGLSQSCCHHVVHV